MYTIIKINKQNRTLILLAFLAFVSTFAFYTSRVYAADNNFADGINSNHELAIKDKAR